MRVACRQLVGTLLLGDCCQQLKIQVAALGNKLLSPSEFEAAAGCSKGKNWKVCIQTPSNIVHTITEHVKLTTVPSSMYCTARAAALCFAYVCSEQPGSLLKLCVRRGTS